MWELDIALTILESFESLKSNEEVRIIQTQLRET